MKHVDAGSADWTIRFWAFDSDGAGVTGLDHTSDAIAVSVVVSTSGRPATPVVLTLVARSSPGVHTDSAITEIGGGEYAIDLANTYVATDGKTVSLGVSATAITGNVYVEQLEVSTALATAAALTAIGAALAGTPITPTGRVASGGQVTLYVGDDCRVRSGTQIQIPVTDAAGALYTKLAAIGAGNLAFGASRPGKSAGEITGTIASLAQDLVSVPNRLLINVEIASAGSGLSISSSNYDFTYQIQQTQDQGGESDDFIEVAGDLHLLPRTVAVAG